jgi:hypothetical protein
MSSTTDIDQEAVQPRHKRRTAFDVSLIVGIVLIVIFLGLFVFEFSRILTMTGKVDHTPPVQLEESASGHHTS